MMSRDPKLLKTHFELKFDIEFKEVEPNILYLFRRPAEVKANEESLWIYGDHAVVVTTNDRDRPNRPMPYTDPDIKNIIEDIKEIPYEYPVWSVGKYAWTKDKWVSYPHGPKDKQLPKSSSSLPIIHIEGI